MTTEVIYVVMIFVRVCRGFVPTLKTAKVREGLPLGFAILSWNNGKL